MTQTITAMYDNVTDAQSALDRLVGAGIDRDGVHLVPGQRTVKADTTSGYEERTDAPGLLTSLKETFLPDEDRFTSGEGVNHGGILLSATVEEGEVQTALGIIGEAGRINLDEREAPWRAGGWTPGR